MRIISGKYKGRRIIAPKNLPVRPTTDLSKESLFNILNHQFNFAGLRVLDLFAGTGNISYEFASRGSQPILCIDADNNCVQFIKKTAQQFDMDISVIRSDVYKFLDKHKGTYDIIFADPPYDFTQEQFEKIIHTVFEKELLEDDGMLIVEHAPQTKLEHLEFFSNDRRYGSSIFSFFEYEQEEIDEDDDEEDDDNIYEEE